MGRTTLQEYCEERQNTQLLQEWDEVRNGGLSPRDVSFGSHRQVWWQCGNGHAWQARVYSRAGGGAGCPYCSGTTYDPASGSLAARHPELLTEWHLEKNGTLSPYEVSPGSHRKVWWRCEHGHAWLAEVKSRVQGCGCPVCVNRRILPGENDLETRYPVLAREWDMEKNGALSPRVVGVGSHRKVWWRCAHGHSWEAAVFSRTMNGTGCPVCEGKRVVAGENDLASARPRLIAEWHPEKNGSLRPDQVSVYSNRRVWWRCGQGHEWRAAIAQRSSRNTGCPICAGRRVLRGYNDLATLEPRLAAQWHPTLNGTLTPDQVTKGSRKKVWWICAEGHVWNAVIDSRTGERRCGCPVCAGSSTVG